MNILQENTSIGTLVAKTPEYASVFEKLGIDYCCKGHKTLKEVCEEKGLHIHEVLRKLQDLQSSSPSIDWEKMSIQQIITHIVQTYHSHLRQELPRISQLLNKVNMKHGERYPYIAELRAVFEPMKDDLLKHLDEEENVVFPLVLERSASQECRKYLDVLDEDHVQTGAFLEKIKALTNGYTPPADACMTHMVMINSLKQLETNIHEHIHKENHILFSRVEKGV